MELARACELSTASVEQRVTVDGLPYLMIERYDRDLTVIRFVDFTRRTSVRHSDSPQQKYQAEEGPSFAQATQLVREATAIPAQTLPRLVEAIGFHWLVGNCDAHGKNYSLLYDGGPATLAPMYDVVSTVVYPELSTRLAMSIGPAREISDVMLTSWDALAQAATLRPAFVRETVMRIARRAVERGEELLRAPEHSNASARAVHERVTEISQRLHLAAS